MALHLIPAADVQAMDDTAALAVSNVVSLPRPAQHPNRADNATIAATHQALQAAQAMHRAARIELDVGRFQPGLKYVSVYFPTIREFVTLGFDYTPQEHGDDEQPTIGATLDIQEIWMRGVDIGVLTTNHTAELETALEKAVKQGAEL